MAVDDTDNIVSGISTGDILIVKIKSGFGTISLQSNSSNDKTTITNNTDLQITGEGSNELTLTGHKAAVNAALDLLNYQSRDNFFGTDTLTLILTDTDEGFSEMRSVDIKVDPAPDSIVALNSLLVMDEDTARNFTLTDFSYSDAIDRNSSYFNEEIDTIRILGVPQETLANGSRKDRGILVMRDPSDPSNSSLFQYFSSDGGKYRRSDPLTLADGSRLFATEVNTTALSSTQPLTLDVSKLELIFYVPEANESSQSYADFSLLLSTNDSAPSVDSAGNPTSDSWSNLSTMTIAVRGLNDLPIIKPYTIPFAGLPGGELSVDIGSRLSDADNKTLQIVSYGISNNGLAPTKFKTLKTNYRLGDVLRPSISLTTANGDALAEGSYELWLKVQDMLTSTPVVEKVANLNLTNSYSFSNTPITYVPSLQNSSATLQHLENQREVLLGSLVGRPATTPIPIEHLLQIPTGDTFNIRLSGIDANRFQVSEMVQGGTVGHYLNFRKAPDQDYPNDANRDGTYELTISVNDEQGNATLAGGRGVVTSELTLKIELQNDPDEFFQLSPGTTTNISIPARGEQGTSVTSEINLGSLFLQVGGSEGSPSYFLADQVTNDDPKWSEGLSPYDLTVNLSTPNEAANSITVDLGQAPPTAPDLSAIVGQQMTLSSGDTAWARYGNNFSVTRAPISFSYDLAPNNIPATPGQTIRFTIDANQLNGANSFLLKESSGSATVVSLFNWDTLSGTGARLEDTNGDGKADVLAIYIHDDGRGDASEALNQTISRSGYLAYIPRVEKDGFIFEIIDSKLQTTLAANTMANTNLYLRTSVGNNSNGFTFAIASDYDGDGVNNMVESFAGDLNNDGVVDASQNSVASMQTIASTDDEVNTWASLDIVSSNLTFDEAISSQLNDIMAAQVSSGSSTETGNYAVELSFVDTYNFDPLTTWSRSNEASDLNGDGLISVNDALAQIQNDLTSSTQDVNLRDGFFNFTIMPIVTFSGNVTEDTKSLIRAAVEAEFSASVHTVVVKLPDGSAANAYIKLAPDGKYYNFTYSNDPNAVGTYRSAGDDGTVGTTDDGPLVKATGVGARMVDYLRDIYGYNPDTGLYSDEPDGFWDNLLLDQAGIQFNLSAVTDDSVVELNNALDLTGDRAYSLADFIDLNGDGKYDFVLDKSTTVDGLEVFSPEAVLLYLRDGYWGDYDANINGQILDPGGPGYFTPVPATTVMNEGWDTETLTIPDSFNVRIGDTSNAPTDRTWTLDLYDPAAIEVGDSGGYGQAPLEAHLAALSRQALQTWAERQGLNSGALVSHHSSSKTDPQAGRGQGVQPFRAVEETQTALSNLGTNLLEILAMGAGSLFALELAGRKLQRRPVAWLAGILPAVRRPRANRKVEGEILAVFLMGNPGSLLRIVAAEVHDDGLTVLVEQALPMELAAASQLDQSQLAELLDQLLIKLEDQGRSHNDLLLFDPQLKPHLDTIKPLGEQQKPLQLAGLRAAISKLGMDDLDQLKTWLSRPSQAPTVQSGAGELLLQELRGRQTQWSEQLEGGRASITGLLELSLSLSQKDGGFSLL